MNYHFKATKEVKGYSARCIELNGCFTQGDSMEELVENMAEALNLLLAEPEDSKILFPLPDKKLEGKRGVIAVRVEPQIAFALCLRMHRIKNKLSQKQVATKMGIVNLFTYQKLESAKTANPQLKTIAKIKAVFPEFDLDEVV